MNSYECFRLFLSPVLSNCDIFLLCHLVLCLILYAGLFTLIVSPFDAMPTLVWRVMWDPAGQSSDTWFHIPLWAWVSRAPRRLCPALQVALFAKQWGFRTKDYWIPVERFSYSPIPLLPKAGQMITKKPLLVFHVMRWSRWFKHILFYLFISLPGTSCFHFWLSIDSL